MGSLLRKEDEKCSEIVSNFLDKKFYNKCDSFERFNDKDNQIKGIDIIFSINDIKYVCDEKAAIRYINRHLNTFAMELSFINRKNILNDGWLLDDKKINDSFLLIYIDKAKNDIIQNEDDIEEIELILVKRNKIISFLEELGWTKDKLIEKTKRIRDNECENYGSFELNRCKFAYSKHLFEKPVNLLLLRDDLRKLSDLNEIIKNV